MATRRAKKMTTRTARNIKRAAELRVEGNSWAVIAPRIGRSTADTARSITQEWPNYWAESFEEARRLYIESVESEGLLTQRELMRPTRVKYDSNGHVARDASGNPAREVRPEDIRQRAAHSILAHAAKLRAQKVHVTGDMNQTHTLADLLYAANNGGFHRKEATTPANRIAGNS